MRPCEQQSLLSHCTVATERSPTRVFLALSAQCLCELLPSSGKASGLPSVCRVEMASVSCCPAVPCISRLCAMVLALSARVSV